MKGINFIIIKENWCLHDIDENSNTGYKGTILYDLEDYVEALVELPGGSMCTHVFSNCIKIVN